jgi:hypothetical protein
MKGEQEQESAEKFRKVGHVNMLFKEARIVFLNEIHSSVIMFD